MRKFFFPLIAILGWTSCSTTQTSVHSSAKNDSLQEAIEAVPQIYRATYTRYADLIHTKLEITPDWKTTQVAGKATIQLKQHFYTSDSVRLNAKGMDIHQVCLLKKEGQKIPLKYSYADNMLRIQLDRMYTKDEDFLMFIDYTAKPEEVKGGGSAAIRDDKGFYFINPDGKLPDKPKEFWTQGETESNSVWFPTIESPDQKMTQEIYITVDSNYKTLSNGLLLSSTNHPDGTRTDYWKQSLPAAPYLTMIAAGDYAIVKDKWKSIELSYYVDPPYEKYARMIFGNTPEMMDFFSRLLGVDYPWEKFAQIVVHDYISGAMENTTAVVHGTSIQQDSGEYIDGNYEDYISHELFHHWFGDLVTCESWSNLTLNEGFADYSEYLWREHKFGRDDADRQNQSEQASYMYATAKDEPALLRFTYDDKEDMYDAISYNKGGRVLHMLRKYVGDSAFFASLKLYLDTKRFSSAEVNDLRMAFEQITGEDLNWYFNQWFVFPGKPSLSISYTWDEVNSQQSILLRQTQDFSKNTLYRIPLDVDFYYNNKVERKRIVMDSAKQEFTFTLPVKPDLVNVDAEKMLLCTKTDKKDQSAFLFQFYHAPLYLDRFESLTKLADNYRTGTPEAKVVMDALNDPYWKIRLTALDNISELAKNNADSLLPKLQQLAQHDSVSDVREAAYKTIGKYYRYQDHTNEFIVALKDPSYMVQARAFKIISEKDPDKAKDLAVAMEADSSSDIFTTLTTFYCTESNSNHLSYFSKAIRKSKGWDRYQVINNFAKYLVLQKEAVINDGIEILESYSENVKKKYLLSTINNCYKSVLAEIKNRKEKTEEQLSKTEKDIVRQPDRGSLERDLRDLNALKEKINSAQDKLSNANE